MSSDGPSDEALRRAAVVLREIALRLATEQEEEPDVE